MFALEGTIFKTFKKIKTSKLWIFKWIFMGSNQKSFFWKRLKFFFFFMYFQPKNLNGQKITTVPCNFWHYLIPDPSIYHQPIWCKLKKRAYFWISTYVSRDYIYGFSSVWIDFWPFNSIFSILVPVGLEIS